jgi:monothiol glutaredoxin
VRPRFDRTGIDGARIDEKRQATYLSAQHHSPHSFELGDGQTMIDKDSFERIQGAVNGNDVTLFMKGSPQFPQCGFSAAVIQILDYLQIKYHSVDVLQDDGIRQGIKEFSNWPTIPQLYVKGEFVGGCDIIREMAQSGELVEMLDEKKIKYAAP